MLTNKEFKQIGKQSFDKVSSLDLVYKYVEIETGLNRILKDTSLKFSKPEDFNDPFDCHESLVDIFIDPNVEKKIFLDVAAQRKLSRRERRKYISKLGDPKNYTKVLKEERQKYKVCCFSELSDDILMWGHYADKHNGICIGFKFEPLYQDYVFYPVNYVKSLQQIDGTTLTPYVFYYMVTLKSSCWSYEKEVRAITKNTNSILVYPRECVKEVIFGCNVQSAKVSSTVKEIKKMGYSDVRFYKMVIDPKTLSLHKVLLP